MIKKQRIIKIFSLLILAVAVAAAPVCAESLGVERADRPKIGLVLGGGSAKGIAHVGVLRVMEELRIPVDCIAGTSMGAIVGALYASGLSVDEIENIISLVDWKDVFLGSPARQDIEFRRKREDFQILSGLTLGVKDDGLSLPKGIINDQKINLLFEMLMLHTVEINDFDKLPIPFRAVAADIETGEMVVMKSGKLADVARASMSLPGVFPPMELDGRVLIDGAIVRNVPVDIARDMGADIIICVDVGKPLATRDDLKTPLAIMNQMLSIMMTKNVQEQIDSLEEEDIYINPELGELDSMDFGRAAEIVLTGEMAARDKAGELSQYTVSDSEYAVFTGTHQRELVRELKIASVEVEVEGESGILPEALESRLRVKEGDTVDIRTLERDAGYVFGTGDFELVDMNMEKQTDNEYALLVRAKEKEWGPNYLRFGMGLENDYEGSSRYNIMFDYTRRWVDNLGAEWKTQANLGSPAGIYSEFYQPLSVNRLFFVSPHVKLEKKLIDLYQGNDRIAQYKNSEYELGIDAGIQPWTYGEVRVGLVFGRHKASLKTGEFKLPYDRFERGGVAFQATLDQLDKLTFPNKGYMANLDFFSSLESLGADVNYNKVKGSVTGAFTFMKQTGIATIKAGSQTGRDLPFYDELELGGFLNLSGLRHNQLRGQHMAMGNVVSYHRIGSSFIGDLYLGGSLEAGNVWQEGFDFNDLLFAGSIFLGYDTVLGPLYLGIGHIDQGWTAGYFYLGRSF